MRKGDAERLRRKSNKRHTVAWGIINVPIIAAVADLKAQKFHLKIKVYE